MIANPVAHAGTQLGALQRVQSWKTFEESLSRAARDAALELRQAADALRRVDNETIHPDADLCLRWMAARVLELGWNKEQFGDQNRTSRGAHENVTERIAQKYQRITFQELCGHLADHCDIDESWRDDPEPYRGPWQITETLDLDPSLLLRGDIPDSDTPAARMRDLRLRKESESAWYRTNADHQLHTGGTDDQWLSDLDDIPHALSLVRVTDPRGREWVALERHQQWDHKDPTDLRSGYRRSKRQLWFRCQANIIRAGDSDQAAWAANENWMGLNAVSTPGNVWTAHLGEYPDIEPWPEALDLGDRERRPYRDEDDPGTDVLPLGWEYAHIDEQTRAPYALATVGCHTESGHDLSAEDTPGAILPSRLLLSLLGATWVAGSAADTDLGLGPVEQEYSWLAGGSTVAFCTSGRGYGTDRVLWVRVQPLQAALAGADLGMWTWVLGEKIYWSGGTPSSDRTDCFAAVRLAPGPLTVWGSTVERDRGRDRGTAGERIRLAGKRAPGIEETGKPGPGRARGGRR
jgi:hypothetical protein